MLARFLHRVGLTNLTAEEVQRLEGTTTEGQVVARSILMRPYETLLSIALVLFICIWITGDSGLSHAAPKASQWANMPISDDVADELARLVQIKYSQLYGLESNAIAKRIQELNDTVVQQHEIARARLEDIERELTRQQVMMDGLAQAAKVTPPKQMPPRELLPTRSSLAMRNIDTLIGAAVEDMHGERAGKIEDLIAFKDGTILFVILSPEGDAGDADRLFPVPWDLVHTSGNVIADQPSREGFALNLDNKRLKGAPSFEKTKWPSDMHAQVLDDAERYYENLRHVSGRPVEASAAMTPPALVRISKLDGSNVESATGEDLGMIKEALVDIVAGRVSYVAVSIGGVLGVGESRLAIPWGAMTPADGARRSKFILTVSKEQLDRAPRFRAGAEHWKEMSDPEWIAGVYSFFSVRPYWRDSTVPKQD